MDTELSVFVAKVFALAYISIGVGTLSGKIDLNKIYDSFEKSQGLTLITGMFTLVIGALLVQNHNIWVQDWTVIITIIGWMALIKGIVLMAFPQWIFSFKNFYAHRNTRYWGIFVLAIGLIFGYFGFFA